MRNRTTIYALVCVLAGVGLLLSSCAEPANQGTEPADQGTEPADQGTDTDFSALDRSLDEASRVLDDVCVEGANAAYIKVGDGWRLRPCDECESIGVEMYWGGNTGGEREIVEALETMSADLQTQEISLLQYAQYTGECP